MVGIWYYLWKCLKVIVSVDRCLFLQGNLAKDLHSDHSIDEEYEDDEDGDPGKGLEGLDEGPEEGADALPLGQQLDQPHDTEEAKEGNRDHVVPRLGRKRNQEIGWKRKSETEENVQNRVRMIISQIK